MNTLNLAVLHWWLHSDFWLNDLASYNKKNGNAIYVCVYIYMLSISFSVSIVDYQSFIINYMFLIVSLPSSCTTIRRKNLLCYKSKWNSELINLISGKQSGPEK